MVRPLRQPHSHETSSDADQPSIPLAAVVALLTLAIAALGFHVFSSDGWFPILDSANLALHEAGHPIVGIFSERAAVYGGTLFQIVFPVLAARHFQHARNPVGTAFSLVWLGENLFNIARYMADARERVLPLVGGGDHDWTEIFSRWGLLQADVRIAGMTRFIGLMLIVSALYRLYRQYRANR